MIHTRLHLKRDNAIARNHGRTDAMLMRVYWSRMHKSHQRWAQALSRGSDAMRRGAVG